MLSFFIDGTVYKREAEKRVFVTGFSEIIVRLIQKISVFCLRNKRITYLPYRRKKE